MRKEYYIKQEKWEDFCKNCTQFGFNFFRGRYEKYVGNRRVLQVWEFSKEVEDNKLDSTTYSGFMYEGEFRHKTAYYAKDLIEQGYIEVVNVR